MKYLYKPFNKRSKAYKAWLILAERANKGKNKNRTPYWMERRKPFMLPYVWTMCYGNNTFEEILCSEVV